MNIKKISISVKTVSMSLICIFVDCKRFIHTKHGIYRVFRTKIRGPKFRRLPIIVGGFFPFFPVFFGFFFKFFCVLFRNDVSN